MVEFQKSQSKVTGSNRLVHKLFEEQAASNPSNPAVVYTDKGADGKVQNHVLNYGELNRKANVLASRLLELKNPSKIIAICTPNSPEMILAELAVLKSGRAFLLLEPTLPPQRLAWMIKDSAAALLLTHFSIAHRFVNLGIPMIAIDGNSKVFESGGEQNPDENISTRDMAYVIYDSDSSGTPNGVILEHHGLANLVNWHNHTFNVTSKDRATHLGSLSFDVSIWEIWTYLAAGAELHLLRDSRELLPERLAQWLLDEKITISFLPTSLLESMMGLEWPPETSLRFVLTGGDRLRRWPTKTLPFKVVNNYGLTECTVVATSGEVLPLPAEASSNNRLLPTIGREISNVRTYVLDQELSPVPDGITGELYLAGAGVGQGYLNRPDLTAERFIPDPFADGFEPGARMFRSGDIVRRINNGELEFLGRVDEQINIRGVHIDPVEIERQILDFPGITQVLVGVQQISFNNENTQHPQLVAYIVANLGIKPDTTKLQSWLYERLPEAMVPSIILPIAGLPKFPNGKIDRRSLFASPLSLQSTSQDEESQSSSFFEKELSLIWQDLLKVRGIGPSANFFELGGDSLLVIRLVSRINDRFKTDFPISEVFNHPQLWEMARLLETHCLNQRHSQ